MIVINENIAQILVIIYIAVAAFGVYFYRMYINKHNEKIELIQLMHIISIVNLQLYSCTIYKKQFDIDNLFKTLNNRNTGLDNYVQKLTGKKLSLDKSFKLDKKLLNRHKNEYVVSFEIYNFIVNIYIYNSNYELVVENKTNRLTIYSNIINNWIGNLINTNEHTNAN